MFSIIKCQAQAWSLIWSDEFNTSFIDTTNWNFEQGNWGWGNNELEYYTNRPVNATINNGNLIIIAKQESYGGSNYTSARMNTKGLHSWTYGKIEARIKLPIGQGLWPAFWMLGRNIDTVNWPQCGEIDIMEHINNDSLIHGTMHWNNGGHIMYGGDTLCNVSQYHIYSVEWDQNSIKWFIDSSQYLEGNIAGGVNSTEEFHLPFYLLLNMAVGGNWPGNPNGTTIFPDTMFVDYVRVYQITTNIRKAGMNMNDKINIHPNPAINQIFIESSSESKKQKAEIVNMVDQSIFTADIEDKSEIDISDLAKGFYFLRIENTDGVAMKKFVKE